MNIYNVSEQKFKKYGCILSGYQCKMLMDTMEHMTLPENVVYKPSVPELENTTAFQEFSSKAFGEMPIQIGFCNGHNQKLNALEYHRSSEINIAVTDMILLLGKQEDISEDFRYDTSKIEAFFIPKGTVVELYATTLHYAPCGIDGAGFKAIVILPKGTNYPSSKKISNENDDKLRTHVNKWIIAHEDGNVENAYIGLNGKNIEI